MQFATNYLGHFALATGLPGALALAGRARIVPLGSSGHLFCPALFDDPFFDSTPYDPLLAYGRSRTATALSAVGATRAWAGDGITCNAVHARGHRHAAPAAHRWTARARRTAQDPAAGCGDDAVRCDVTAPRGDRWALPRGRRRGRGRRPTHSRPRGRGVLRARPAQRGPAPGDVPGAPGRPRGPVPCGGRGSRTRPRGPCTGSCPYASPRGRVGPSTSPAGRVVVPAAGATPGGTGATR